MNIEQLKVLRQEQVNKIKELREILRLDTIHKFLTTVQRINMEGDFRRQTEELTKMDGIIKQNKPRFLYRGSNNVLKG